MVQAPDGTVRWGKFGEADAVDGFDIWETHRKLYQWVRVLRGAVVSGAFSIERNLNGVISYYFVEHDEQLFRQFTDSILETMSFDRKVGVAFKIAVELTDEEEARGLRKKIQEFQRLRNAMAHRPFWFEPVEAEGGKFGGLVAKIRVSDDDTVLNQSFAEHVNELVGSLISETASLGSHCAKLRERDQESGPIFRFEARSLS